MESKFAICCKLAIKRKLQMKEVTVVHTEHGTVLMPMLLLLLDYLMASVDV